MKVRRLFEQKGHRSNSASPDLASWANPIDARFGPLRHFTRADPNHPDHTALTRALHAYLRRHNRNTRHPPMSSPPGTRRTLTHPQRETQTRRACEPRPVRVCLLPRLPLRLM